MARFMNYVNGNIATEAYHGFVAAYREVAEKLRLGDRSAAFPPGSFIPSLAMID